MSFPLRLSDGDFRASLRWRLGDTDLPHGAPASAENSLAPHTLGMPSLPCPMLRKGGWPSTKEPGLTVLRPQMAGPPAGAQGNLVFPVKGEQCVGDVSVMHSGSATHCALAEKTDDGAVARQDADKISQYPGNSADRYRCVPLTVETIGRLSEPFMDLPTYVKLRSTATAPHVRAICLGRAP
jgi:hypothetical protein